MRAIDRDYLRGATITNAAAITTANGHPITNIQLPSLASSAWILPEAVAGDLYGVSLYGRLPYGNIGLDLYSTIIDFDLGGIQEFDTFGLAGNNWRNVDITLSWSETDINAPDGSASYVSPSPEESIVVPLGTATGRYFRITISNIETDGNYLVIGRVGLGKAFVLPRMGITYDVDHITTALSEYSDTGQLYGGPKTIYRQVSVYFPNIEDQEELLELFRLGDIFRPTIWSFDEECLNEPNLYGAIVESNLAFNYNEGGFYTSRIVIREVF